MTISVINVIPHETGRAAFTVKRNKTVLGTISKGRGTFTAVKGMRLTLFELECIARVMGSR